ncbi:GntR family transcriptional regulator [Inquilinus limosus]|uniref:GntR family transcriptional regulator n=1 Tax=Inquilinus limosus TaxID=171674 RepID=UPI003F190FEA
MTDTATNASPPRLYEIVERALRSSIGTGRLPAGLVLLEGPIAGIFQTSRAPVQRALARLEADGLIHRFEGRGFLVGPEAAGVAPLRADIRGFGLEAAGEIDEAQQSRASWERIYATAERQIASCLVFGRYRIVEAEMADHFGVSRTVVRDVLGRLQERGLIEKNASSHWIAGPLTARAIRDLYEMRRLLEPPALVGAAPSLPRGEIEAMLERLRCAEAAGLKPPPETMDAVEEDLHVRCVLATPNARLADALRHNQLPLLSTHAFTRSLGIADDQPILTEHRLVLELLAQEAWPAAAAVLETHLRAAERRAIARLKTLAVIPEPSNLAPYLTKTSGHEP